MNSKFYYLGFLPEVGTPPALMKFCGAETHSSALQSRRCAFDYDVDPAESLERLVEHARDRRHVA